MVGDEPVQSTIMLLDMVEGDSPDDWSLMDQLPD